MPIQDRMPKPPIQNPGESPMLAGGPQAPQNPPTAAPQQAGGMAGPGMQAAPEGDVSTPGGIPPSEQEQLAYDNVVVEGVEKLDAKAGEALAMINAYPGDKAEAAGQFAARIAISIDEEKGGAVPDDVVIPAAAEIGEQLADRLDAAGMQVDDAFVQRGAGYMMKALADYYGVDEAEIQEFMASIPQDQLQGYHDQEAQYYAGVEGPGAAPPQQAAPAPAPPQGAGPMGAV